MKNHFKILFLIPLLFFIVSLITISDYGTNWDEPIHFFRGQAYLHFFLTGNEDYKDLNSKQSFFQSDDLNYRYWIQSDSGHPPLNGELAALTNYIFFQKLGVLGDIESHHFVEIITATLLVFVVALFAYETYGLFAAIIASLTLALYPLFFAESHFNIKDPVEAAFFGFTIYAFWRSLDKGNWRWVIASAVGVGLTLGTKFNALFLPVIIGPYLLLRFLPINFRKIRIPQSYLISLFVFPLIVVLIFIGSWPFLWRNTFNNLSAIFGYYETIGSGFNYQTKDFYLPYGFNLYPLFWIITTTPPWVLILSFIGVISALIRFRENKKVTLLWLIWLVVPFLRVTLPKTSIYGGVRQIMEYIPALALLSGLGAYQLREWIFKFYPSFKQSLISLVLILLFVPQILVLVKIHPNENVYFNFLIGGLPGAKEKNIPSWGNSYGNAYYQAVEWLNKNGEYGAKLALIQGTSLNIPNIMLRSDLSFNNQSWSAINRDGEYLLELTHQSDIRAYPYAWDYVEVFLEPVYEVKVDGVAIAKLWKNDLEHTKPEYKKPVISYSGLIKTFIDKDIIFELDDTHRLVKMTLSNGDAECKIKGSVELSLDGEHYGREPEPLPVEQVTEKDKKLGEVYFYFAAKKAKFIKISNLDQDSCLFNNPTLQLKILQE